MCVLSQRSLFFPVGGRLAARSCLCPPPRVQAAYQFVDDPSLDTTDPTMPDQELPTKSMRVHTNGFCCGLALGAAEDGCGAQGASDLLSASAAKTFARITDNASGERGSTELVRCPRHGEPPPAHPRAHPRLAGPPHAHIHPHRV